MSGWVTGLSKVWWGGGGRIWFPERYIDPCLHVHEWPVSRYLTPTHKSNASREAGGIVFQIWPQRSPSQVPGSCPQVKSVGQVTRAVILTHLAGGGRGRGDGM